MNAFRVGAYLLASILVSLSFSAAARADIRVLAQGQTQTLPRPTGVAYTNWGNDVAIDGGSIIVLAAYDGGQQALLYRRNNTGGSWVYRRALVTWTGPYVRSSVAMRNGIAAVQFGDQISIFELSGGDYVRGSSAAPIRHHGGLAISGNRLLIGGDNCDYDAVIYQKDASGSWGITGRLDDNQGQCLDASYDYGVELYYDTAILRAPYETEGRAWRRNGNAVDWVPAGTLTFRPDEEVAAGGAYALQGNTAVAFNGAVWRRTGPGSWSRQESTVTSVDHDQGPEFSYPRVYRDGILVALQTSGYSTYPHAYVEVSPGQFEDLAVIQFYDAWSSDVADVSGRSVVARWYGGSQQFVRVSILPAPLRTPVRVVNDFEDRNASDLTFTGGQFSLAARGANDVLAQTSSNGLAIALANDSDWTDHQRVEADITPAFSGTGSWVGLVARYIDADNYYYLAVRDNRTYGVYKRVNGVETLLHDGYFYNEQQPTFRAVLDVTGTLITVTFSFQQGATFTDSSLTNGLHHGRAGLATSFARADFDDLHIAGTEPFLLFSRDYSFTGFDYQSGMHELSGVWRVFEEGDREHMYFTGLSQTDASGDARAVIGTPVQNQEIITRMRVDAFAASQTGAWIGLLARYVDARNFYYVTMRATGQLQLRKIVNGVITVLASTNFTPALGQYYDVRLRVINDQLQLYLNQSLVLSAHDGEITSGQYGVASYRARANWSTFDVLQP